jgi:hypothetical protein
MDRGRAVDTYCSAWDEADSLLREAMLRTVWAEGATYTDPNVHVVGLAELVAHIERVLVRYPGSRIVRTSAVDAHHSVARFGWKKIWADGSSLPEGIDFVEFSEAGAIKRVIGFFGPLPSRELAAKR